jgi:fatty-acyl-CoA synthase
MGGDGVECGTDVVRWSAVELNMASIFSAVAEAHPGRECLIHRDRLQTWAQTEDRTNRLGMVLADAGLGRRQEFGSVDRWESVHDQVGIYLYNSIEYIETMIGSWKARCAPFNINYRYVAEELEYLLVDSDARAIVFHSAFAPTLAEVIPRLASPPSLLIQVPDDSGNDILPTAVAYDDALAGVDPDGSAPAPDLSGDDLYICYTGGTTGMPKGAMWRQADFLVSALTVGRRDGTEYESLGEIVADARGSVRALPAPPLMHGAAHWNALSALIAGGTVIIQDNPQSIDPVDVLSTAERHGATSLLLVGDPIARPLVDAMRRHSYDLSRVRHVLSGGAILSPSVKAEISELIPTATIVDVLGSSESGRQGVATTRPGEKPTAEFKPTSTAVVLDEGMTRRLEPGSTEVGWLAQTGRVPLGYLGDGEKTRRTFPVVEGVRHAVPGDRARLTADGSIELLGRDSVCINTGGEKVFAEEVETALKSHPDVFDAVVCGRSSERWGQEVVGLIELRSGVAQPTDESVLEAAGKHIARYKLPKQLVRLEKLVRAPSGKADYRWAKQVAEEARPG